MRPKNIFLHAAGALVVAGSFFSLPASATAGETESRSLFASGRELRLAGRCADAIPMFRRAMETYPEGLGALRNVAECEEELERFASARRSYWDLRLASRQSAASKYQGWDAEAEAAHARLGQKVGKVTISLKGDRPEGLVIRFNGRPFDPRLIGVEIEHDNGPLEVSVSFGAGPPLTKTVQVRTAGRHPVEFELAELPRPPAATTPPPGDVTRADGLTSMQIGGIVALGVGGAALVGTVVTSVMRQSALGSITDRCSETANGYDCPSDLEDERSTGETSSVLWNVFTATAIVGAGVGVTLLVLGGDDDDDPEAAGTPPRATVAVSPLPGGGFIGVRGAL